MIQEYEKLLELFVSKNDYLRPILLEPFKEENFVFASDARSVISVHICQLPLKLMYFEDNFLHATEKFKVKNNCEEVISVKRMAAAIGKLPKIRKCPECKGTGEVEFVYNAKFDGCQYYISKKCPLCDGNGTITHRFAIKIGEHYFTLEQLLKLRKACDYVGVRSVEWIYQSTDLNVFELTQHVKVGLMAIIMDRESDEVKEKAVIV